MRRSPPGRPPRPRSPATTARRLGAGVAVVLGLALLLVACEIIPLPRLPYPLPPEGPEDRPAPPRRPGEPEPPPRTGAPDDGTGHDLEARRLRYLELAWNDLRRLERAIGDIGTERNGAAALTGAALRAHRRGGDPATYVNRSLRACGGAWHKGGCERAALDLARVALQYPGTLPGDLGRRLRRDLAASPAPPPSRGEIRSPWSFRQTENQRMVTMARSLAAHRLAGSGGSAAGRAWSSYAEAFLVAHDASGWYEADSPGYLGISIEGLLLLHDHAPTPRVRSLAGRQLNLLFADWAAQHVDGVPAGARTRTYAHWALGTRNTPWRAWAWLAAGLGQPSEIEFGDFPDLAASSYRVPDAVADLLRQRESQGTYEVRERRRIDPQRRRSVDAALYSYATPDYILSASQAIQGLELGVSGGQEIAASLLPEGGEFAPLYLWSRVSDERTRSQRWRSRSDQEKTVAHENRLLARMGSGGEPGYAYLAPPWSAPQRVGERVVVSRHRDTYVALVSDGGWQLAPAPERFPGYFGGDRKYRGSWAAVPRRQPAAVALVAGRAAEVGSFERWKERARGFDLAVDRRGREPVRLVLRGAGPTFSFQPGRSATVGGRTLDARSYPVHASPFLRREGRTWRFRHGGVDYRFEPLRR